MKHERPGSPTRAASDEGPRIKDCARNATEEERRTIDLFNYYCKLYCADKTGAAREECERQAWIKAEREVKRKL